MVAHKLAIERLSFLFPCNLLLAIDQFYIIECDPQMFRSIATGQTKP